jgi:hypothetical protein
MIAIPHDVTWGHASFDDQSAGNGIFKSTLLPGPLRLFANFKAVECVAKDGEVPGSPMPIDVVPLN